MSYARSYETHNEGNEYQTEHIPKHIQKRKKNRPNEIGSIYFKKFRNTKGHSYNSILKFPIWLIVTFNYLEIIYLLT